MSEIVCQVSNQAGQVEFIWSSQGGFFRPYIISGQQLTELRARAAGQTRPDRRRAGNWSWSSPSTGRGGIRHPGNFRMSWPRPASGFSIASYRRRTRRPAKYADGWRTCGSSPDCSAWRSSSRSDRPTRGRSSPCHGTWFTTNGPPRGRVPEGAGYRAMAAVLVGPLQPDQRAAGRALEAVAALGDPRVVVVIDPTVHEGLQR